MENNNTMVGITTFDNPYDYFDDFSNWYKFDEDNGYHTCSKIDRFSSYSNTDSDELLKEDLDDAFNKILEYDFANVYKKVYKTT